jgi:hypothetical protein
MAYVFAISFMNQYPAEKVGPSNFACDPDIRNAKYTSMLLASVVPVSESEKPVFDMLDRQNFTLNVDFVNTKITCSTLTVEHVIASLIKPLRFRSCTENGGVLSVSVNLPTHEIKVRIAVRSIQLIGGLRIGLSGPGAQADYSTLQELNFTQSFYSEENHTLAQVVSVDMIMTKVC